MTSEELVEKVLDTVTETNWNITLFRRWLLSDLRDMLKQSESERDAARAEVERLRTFIVAYDEWTNDDAATWGDAFDRLIAARDNIDATPEPTP